MRRSTRHIISIDTYQPSSEGVEDGFERQKGVKVQAEEVEEVEEFEDSDVLTYLIGCDEDNSDIVVGHTGMALTSDSSTACPPLTPLQRMPLQRLKSSDWSSYSPGVKTRWYSMHSDKRYRLTFYFVNDRVQLIFHCLPRSGLVVVGGQGGRVSTFRMTASNVKAGEEVSSLFSFKPHGSTWVSDVMFCGGQRQALASLLLTSANDG